MSSKSQYPCQYFVSLFIRNVTRKVAMFTKNYHMTLNTISIVMINDNDHRVLKRLVG
jgi:hypothetical protein